MYASELQGYLHERIPLSRAMQVEVLRADPQGVVLRAPLEPNINHRDTVFGGSASAVAVLAAWSLIDVRLQADAQPGRIVVRRSTMDFERPIAAAFTARSTTPDASAWARLLATLRRGRMGRIEVRSVLECNGERVGELQGEFVVIPPAEA
jgi:thioesterase domain-containing protein